MMIKTALRASLRSRRRAMDPQDHARRSRELCRLVLGSPQYAQARCLYGYLPFDAEVDLLPLLRQALLDGKQVALPQCHGPQMRFILTTDLSRIRHTPFGVPEPADSAPVARDPSALVIVPGLAFDSRGFRVGYGGGYYDRFLAAEPRHPTIALCFDFQLLDHLEPDSHDMPVQIVFSR